ncbi:MAG: hypothetical protein RLZZ540_389 [Bacteroidota bacterium]|jgi:mannose-6-phosphate isomerase class I
MERNTQQFLIPVKKEKNINYNYNVYPSHQITKGKIAVGYKTLVSKVLSEKKLILDGYIGVDWKEVVESICKEFSKNGKTFSIVAIKDFFKTEKELESLVVPFLGGDDPIFGTRTTLSLTDYLNVEKISNVDHTSDVDIQIFYGTGASHFGVDGLLVYFDLPKNEIQYRMRSGGINNLGFFAGKESKLMYKHFYFVDWVILNKEKKRLLPKISIIVDQQRPDYPTWMLGQTLRDELAIMSQTYFRVRPWFEPGVWGGQWIKDRVSSINKKVPNYAWSFEMIVPENGLLFEDNGTLLEVSFDMLMFQESSNILGKAANRFKEEFPIRFNFLDTFDGGNLSVQCHPTPSYVKNKFGENFTQDETYYILDTIPGAVVYLGFQEGINPQEFRQDLESSFETKEILDVEKYIQKFKVKKHDLYLIPHGTVHSSGVNNMVLEISATAYLFTFKMYDWQRLDLEGNPRPLNIKRAFDNLNFERQGKIVSETLISKQTVILSGINWKVVHLPTHKDHFYDVFRYEFQNEIEIETLNQCHILMLVEGTAIVLEIGGYENKIFNYLETFAISASANKYKLINRGKGIAKVIVSFVKDEACE